MILLGPGVQVVAMLKSSSGKKSCIAIIPNSKISRMVAECSGLTLQIQAHLYPLS